MKEILKDNHGRTIGTIEKSGSREKLRDDHGRLLGEFDGRVTRDSHGRLVGTGNLLGTLLKKWCCYWASTSDVLFYHSN